MRVILLVVSFLLTNYISAQINLDKLKISANKAQELISPNSLSTDEIVRGLKEALIVGAKKSSANASSVGGFNNNSLIRIPFPVDARKMRTTLLKAGMKSQVDEFEHALNAAAEEASKFSKEIFVKTVKGMNINDAISILQGDNNAATIYLKKQTSQELYIKFRPIVEKSIVNVKLTKYWSSLVDTYNTIPLTKDINSDLEDYVTKQAIEGLFILIAKEEKNIRSNPKARVSEILQKVFR